MNPNLLEYQAMILNAADEFPIVVILRFMWIAA